MFEEIEFRDGLEFRAVGRVLSGVAMRYGDVADLAMGVRERFEVAAFQPLGDVSLNLQHDSQRELARTGNGLTVIDGPRSLELRAVLTGSAELELVKRGALNGFSIEFHALSQRTEGDVRVVQKAKLSAIALVDRAAYPASKVEVRARLGQTMRASIPTGRRLDCDCVDAGCQVEFEDGALEFSGELVAAFGNYQSPLVSAQRGTLQVQQRDGGPAVEIDLPDSDVGRAVLAASSAAGLVVRPYVDRRTAEYETTAEGVRVYSVAPVRAVIVSATDARRGWPDPELVPTPDLGDEGRRAAPGRRRLWL